MAGTALQVDDWSHLAGILITTAAATPVQMTLMQRFRDELEDPRLSRSEQLKILSVALAALLATHASGCGEVATT